MSFLSGLFGGAKPQIVEDSPYRRQQVASLNQIGSLAPAYATMAAQGQAGYNAYNGQYNAAVQKRADYLNTNPYTDSRTAGDIAQSTAGIASNYAGAKSRLSAESQRRGIDERGSLESLEGGYAGAISSADTTEKRQQWLDTGTRSGQAVDLLDGVRNGYTQRQAQGLSGQGSIYGQQLNGASSIRGEDVALNTTNTNAVNEANRANQQMWGSFLSTAGQFAGAEL